MRKAAVYVRMAVAGQGERAIDRQIAPLRQAGSAFGYEIAEDRGFADDGHSGATLARPGLDRLRKLAASGSIGAVLARSPDRLSRSCADYLFLLEEFGRSGVEVVFLPDPPETRAPAPCLPAGPIA